MGFRVWGLGGVLGIRVKKGGGASEVDIFGLGCRIKVQGLGFWALGLGLVLRVEGRENQGLSWWTISGLFSTAT